MGSAVARTLAREGAQVFLAGPTKSKLDTVAESIAPGGRAHVATVDALDEDAVDAHLESVVENAGQVDISFNAVGFDNGEQGVRLTEITRLKAEDGGPMDIAGATLAAAAMRARLIDEYSRTHFVTAKAAASPMTAQHSGVIITLSNPMAQAPAALSGCFGQYAAVVENLTVQLAAELGPQGCPRCLRAADRYADVGHRARRRARPDMAQGCRAIRRRIRRVARNDRWRHVARPADHGPRRRRNRGLRRVRSRAGLTGTVANVTGGAVAD